MKKYDFTMKKSFRDLLTYFRTWLSQIVIKIVIWLTKLSKSRDKPKLLVFSLQKAFIRVVEPDWTPLKMMHVLACLKNMRGV